MASCEQKCFRLPQHADPSASESPVGSGQRLARGVLARNRTRPSGWFGSLKIQGPTCRTAFRNAGRAFCFYSPFLSLAKPACLAEADPLNLEPMALHPLALLQALGLVSAADLLCCRSALDIESVPWCDRACTFTLNRGVPCAVRTVRATALPWTVIR
jgi:hypothetical protein